MYGRIPVLRIPACHGNFDRGDSSADRREMAGEELYVRDRAQGQLREDGAELRDHDD